MPVSNVNVALVLSSFFILSLFLSFFRSLSLYVYNTYVHRHSIALSNSPAISPHLARADPGNDGDMVPVSTHTLPQNDRPEGSIDTGSH